MYNNTEAPRTTIKIYPKHGIIGEYKMAALSDYLESQLLNHLFRANTINKPGNISVALTTSVGKDSDTGATLPEVPADFDNGGVTTTTGYSRLNLGNPATTGNTVWGEVGVDNTTAYVVDNGNVPSHSGNFYPLYLDEAAAIAADTGNPPTAIEYSFSKYDGVQFFSPAELSVSGAAENTTQYEIYDGNGFIKNNDQMVFGTALSDWGWVSGIALIDSSVQGEGNVLMYSELSNPRYVYTGDNIKFDSKSLEISLD